MYVFGLRPEADDSERADRHQEQQATEGANTD
jgi:hypothetical protein